jgi:hypothetical protein
VKLGWLRGEMGAAIPPDTAADELGATWPSVPRSALNPVLRLAEEVWRLRRRVERASVSTSAESLRGMTDSADRLQAILGDIGVVAQDHTGTVYVDGTRLTVLQVEGEPVEGQPLWILETVKPTVELDGQVISEGQVILTTTQPAGVAK